jgi:acetyltransferase
MSEEPLDRFFEPARVQVVSNGQRESGDKHPAWSYPDVPVSHSRVETLAFEDLGPDSLVVLDVASSERDSVLQRLAESGVRAVLVPPATAADRPDPVDSRQGATTAEGPARPGPGARGGDLRVLGPGASVHLTGPGGGRTATRATAGRVAVVADDPMMADVLATRASESGAAIGPVVSVGAGIDVGFGEVAARVARDPSIDLVLGRTAVVQSRIVAEIRGIESETPIAISAGDGPSLSITNGFEVAGSTLTERLLEQAGTVPVDSLDGVLQGAPALAGQPSPDPETVVVVSNAGGPGVMAIDAVGASGLDVARLDQETVERVERAIPDHGSAQNPLDLVADSDVSVFETVLGAVLEDENVGAAVVISAPNPLVDFEDLAEIVAGASRRYSAPLVAVLMGGERTQRPAEILQAAGIPNYFDPYRAVGALDLLRQQTALLPNRTRPNQSSDDLPTDSLEWVEGREEPGGLSGQQASDLMAELGVETAEREPAEGLEMVLSAQRTALRGPVVVAGIAEFAGAVGDLAVRAAPLARADAEDMLGSLQGAPVFEGARGTAPVATGPLLDTLAALSTVITAERDVDRIALPGVQATAEGLWVPAVELERGTPEPNPMPRG